MAKGVSGKYSEGAMKSVGGKIDSGSGMGDKQIPPNIGSGGAGSETQGVNSPLQPTSSRKQIPPMSAKPSSGPPIAD